MEEGGVIHSKMKRQTRPHKSGAKGAAMNCGYGVRRAPKSAPLVAARTPTREYSLLLELIDHRALSDLLDDLQADHVSLLCFLDGLVLHLHRIHRLLELAVAGLHLDAIADLESSGELDDGHPDLAVVVGYLANLLHSSSIIPPDAPAAHRGEDILCTRPHSESNGDLRLRSPRLYPLELWGQAPLC